MNTKMERLTTLCKRVGFVAMPISLLWWVSNVSDIMAKYPRDEYLRWSERIYNFQYVGLSTTGDMPFIRSGLFWVGLVSLATWGVLAYINSQEDAAEVTGEAENQSKAEV